MIITAVTAAFTFVTTFLWFQHRHGSTRSTKPFDKRQLLLHIYLKKTRPTIGKPKIYLRSKNFNNLPQVTSNVGLAYNPDIFEEVTGPNNDVSRYSFDPSPTPLFNADEVKQKWIVTITMTRQSMRKLDHIENFEQTTRKIDISTESFSFFPDNSKSILETETDTATINLQNITVHFPFNESITVPIVVPSLQILAEYTKDVSTGTYFGLPNRYQPEPVSSSNGTGVDKSLVGKYNDKDEETPHFRHLMGPIDSPVQFLNASSDTQTFSGVEDENRFQISHDQHSSMPPSILQRSHSNQSLDQSQKVGLVETYMRSGSDDEKLIHLVIECDEKTNAHHIDAAGNMISPFPIHMTLPQGCGIKGEGEPEEYVRATAEGNASMMGRNQTEKLTPMDVRTVEQIVISKKNMTNTSSKGNNGTLEGTTTLEHTAITAQSFSIPITVDSITPDTSLIDDILNVNALLKIEKPELHSAGAPVVATVVNITTELISAAAPAVDIITELIPTAASVVGVTTELLSAGGPEVEITTDPLFPGAPMFDVITELIVPAGAPVVATVVHITSELIPAAAPVIDFAVEPLSSSDYNPSMQTTQGVSITHPALITDLTPNSTIHPAHSSTDPALITDLTPNSTIHPAHSSTDPALIIDLTPNSTIHPAHSSTDPSLIIDLTPNSTIHPAHSSTDPALIIDLTPNSTREASASTEPASTSTSEKAAPVRSSSSGFELLPFITFIMGVLGALLSGRVWVAVLCYYEMWVTDSLQRMEHESIELMTSGRFGEASVLLQKAIVFVNCHRGRSHIDMAGFKHLLAKASISLGQGGFAEALLASVMQAYECFGEDTYTVKVLEDLTQALHLQGRVSDAYGSLRRALLILEREVEEMIHSGDVTSIVGNSSAMEAHLSAHEEAYRQRLLQIAAQRSGSPMTIMDEFESAARVPQELDADSSSGRTYRSLRSAAEGNSGQSMALKNAPKIGSILSSASSSSSTYYSRGSCSSTGLTGGDEVDKDGSPISLFAHLEEERDDSHSLTRSSHSHVAEAMYADRPPASMASNRQSDSMSSAGPRSSRGSRALTGHRTPAHPAVTLNASFDRLLGDLESLLQGPRIGGETSSSASPTYIHFSEEPAREEISRHSEASTGIDASRKSSNSEWANMMNMPTEDNGGQPDRGLWREAMQREVSPSINAVLSPPPRLWNYSRPSGAQPPFEETGNEVAQSIKEAPALPAVKSTTTDECSLDLARLHVMMGNMLLENGLLEEALTSFLNAFCVYERIEEPSSRNLSLVTDRVNYTQYLLARASGTDEVMHRQATTNPPEPDINGYLGMSGIRPVWNRPKSPAVESPLPTTKSDLGRDDIWDSTKGRNDTQRWNLRVSSEVSPDTVVFSIP